MVATPVGDVYRLAAFVVGVIMLACGVVAAVVSSRVAPVLCTFGLVIVARAIWWNRGSLLGQPGRWPRLAVVVACAIVIGMYGANQDMGGDPTHPRGDGHYRPVLARGDGHMSYLMARSTALDFDWVFDNDLKRFGDPWGQPRTKTGRKAIAHPIGPALVWTPLIWIADAGAVAANVMGAKIELHGYTEWHQRIVFLSSALFACGAVLLGRRLALRVVGGSWAPAYGAVAVLLGTPLTYYATFMPSYAHAMDAFACAAFLAYWAFTVGRRDLRRWLILGVLLGLATLVRVQELAMGVVVAVEVGVRIVQHRRELPALVHWILGGALALGVTLVMFLPQLLEWHLVFGSITELPQGAKYTRLEAPMVMELLFAPRNGWFSTTPIAYAGVIGLCCLPKRARLVAVGLVATVAIQVYLNSTILDWWGGAGFGQRRMCNVTLPLVVGHAALLWRLGRFVARWRWPTWLSHGLVIAGFGSLVVYNLAKVGKLHSGKPAPAELSPSCCDDLPRPLRRVARWFYERIGDPFQFPASALYAVRHDVPLRRWDESVGNYPFVPPLHTLLDDSLWRQRGSWALGGPGMESYLVAGFTRSFSRGRTFRYTTAKHATALVPNLMPYGQRLTLWLSPGGASHAIVRWNGAIVADVELAGWTPVKFDLPDIALHTNELTIESTPGPTASDGIVGVGVSSLEFQFIPPPPSK